MCLDGFSEEMTPELCTCVCRGEQGGREYCKHMDQDRYRVEGNKQNKNEPKGQCCCSAEKKQLDQDEM